MFALVSLEKTQLPPGSVLRMPATWEEYQTLSHQRGDSSIPRIKYHEIQSQSQFLLGFDLQSLIERALQITYSRNTSAAARDLRERLRTGVNNDEA